MHLGSSLVSAALIGVGCVSLCARAEAQGTTTPQSSVGSDGTGLVFVDAILIEGGNLIDPTRPCSGTTIIGLGQITDGKYVGSLTQRGPYKAFGLLKCYEPNP